MGKRKKANPTTEPRKNHDLSPHCHPTTTTTPERKRRPPPLDPTPPSTASETDPSPDPSPPSSPGSVRRLIEPYSKPRLAAILAESTAADRALRARLAAAAHASPSHRRLFVHGLPPRADAAAIADAFSRFGPVSDSHAVAAAGAGRCCRGYGFVTFASRAAARRALRGAASVSVAGRPVSAQFASAAGGGGGGAGRRVYVTNVAPDAGAERLRAFFAGFGELEGGPFGFDGETGRSRGYALFVYRAAAGAAAAVAEPYRVFEGRTLRCQLADEPKRKAKANPAAPPAVVAASAAGTPAAAEAPALQPVLDAIAVAGVGELATYARDPVQAAALLGKNPALAAVALSSALASAAAVVGPSPAAASAPMPVAVATARAATATAAKATPVAVAPSLAMPMKFGVRPSGSAGLLGGPYKLPSSPVVMSSRGRR